MARSDLCNPLLKVEDVNGELVRLGGRRPKQLGRVLHEGLVGLRAKEIYENNWICHHFINSPTSCLELGKTSIEMFLNKNCPARLCNAMQWMSFLRLMKVVSSKSA